MSWASEKNRVMELERLESRLMSRINYRKGQAHAMMLRENDRHWEDPADAFYEHVLRTAYLTKVLEKVRARLQTI